MHAAFEVLEAIPVAVGFLHHDVAFQQQPLEDFADVEGRVAGIAHADGDVLEVAIERHVARAGLVVHE